MHGGRAREFPVGTGRLAVPLLERGVDLYGFDNSPEMLRQLLGKLAERAMQEESTRFNAWDALHTPYPCTPQTFDVAAVAFASFSLIHSNMTTPVEDNRVLRELNRLLPVGGRVVVNDYRTTLIDRQRLDEPHVFDHVHTHPVHGEILEEQRSRFRVEPNRLVHDQVIRYRTSRLVRISDGTVLRESTEVTPIWDIASFRVLGKDAGLEHVASELVDFYADETINHVFVKRHDL